MLIQNGPSKYWIKPHIKHLLEKRDEEASDDKINLINLRLASLTSKYCHIKMGNDLMEEAFLIMGRIEVGIKLGREISKFGIINIPSAITCLDDIHDSEIKEIIKNTLQHLLDAGHTEISSSSLVLGIQGGLSCFRAVSSAGYFLVSN
jgi:hypothetical protein